MENWIGITLIICVVLYVIRGGIAIDKERKKARDDFMNPPNKPTGPPPIPPPVYITMGGGGGAGGLKSGVAHGTNGIVPNVYGTVNPIYALTSVDPLTKDQAEKMQKELENHLFSNLARPHHKIPILESPKRKDEKHEKKENPTRKITY